MTLQLLFPSAEKLLHFRLEINATVSEGILSRILTLIEQAMAIYSVCQCTDLYPKAISLTISTPDNSIQLGLLNAWETVSAAHKGLTFLL